MARVIEIDGVAYVQTESLGWQSSAGVYAIKVLGLDGEERTAVRGRGTDPWRLWTPEDRIGRAKGGGG